MSSKVLHILFVLLFISKNCIGCWGGGIGVPIFLYGGLGSGKSSKIKTKQVLSLDVLFSSNQNIHKSSNLSIEGSGAQEQRPHELL